MAEPKLQDHYVYSHDKGLGHEARGDALSDDMAKLDMTPGTEVVIEAIDDAGWMVVSWTDETGLGRRTAIYVATLNALFAKTV